MVEESHSQYTFADFANDCDKLHDSIMINSQFGDFIKYQLCARVDKMKQNVKPWAKTHAAMERTLDQILNDKSKGYSYGDGKKAIFSSTLPSDSFYAKTCELAKEASQYGMPESITINFKTPNKQGVSYSKEAIADIESKLKGDEHKS